MYHIGKLLFLVAVLSVAVMAGGALMTYLTRDAVLDEILNHAQNRNFEALEKRFAWNELRQKAKVRIREQKRGCQSSEFPAAFNWSV